MNQKTFIIRDRTVLKHLMAFLEAQPEEPLLEVVVKKHQEDRTIKQNSLMWLWITVIGHELGWTKTDVHFDLRKRLLVPIYERDDEGYAAMINSIRKLYTKGFKQEATTMHNQIVKMTSTTSAKVKQFAEYLTDIERDMAGKGIILPHPEDRYYESLMI